MLLTLYVLERVPVVEIKDHLGERGSSSKMDILKVESEDLGVKKEI